MESLQKGKDHMVYSPLDAARIQHTARIPQSSVSRQYHRYGTQTQIFGLPSSEFPLQQSSNTPASKFGITLTRTMPGCAMGGGGGGGGSSKLASYLTTGLCGSV